MWRLDGRWTQPKDPELLSEGVSERSGEGRRSEDRRDVGRYFPRPSASPPFDPVLRLLFFFFLSFTAPGVLAAVQMILLCCPRQPPPTSEP